jgi:hypothetical protein
MDKFVCDEDELIEEDKQQAAIEEAHAPLQSTDTINGNSWATISDRSDVLQTKSMVDANIVDTKSPTNTTLVDGSNIKKEFTTTPSVGPTNVLVDYSPLQKAMKEFACPKCMLRPSCVQNPDYYKTLELSQVTNGFASVVTISCKKCKAEVATVEP